MVRELVEEGLAGEDFAGISFSFCEENTDVPAHLRRPGSDTIGFQLVGRTFKIVWVVGDDQDSERLLGDERVRPAAVSGREARSRHGGPEATDDRGREDAGRRGSSGLARCHI